MKKFLLALLTSLLLFGCDDKKTSKTDDAINSNLYENTDQLIEVDTLSELEKQQQTLKQLQQSHSILSSLNEPKVLNEFKYTEIIDISDLNLTDNQSIKILQEPKYGTFIHSISNQKLQLSFQLSESSRKEFIDSVKLEFPLGGGIHTQTLTFINQHIINQENEQQDIKLPQPNMLGILHTLFNIKSGIPYQNTLKLKGFDSELPIIIHVIDQPQKGIFTHQGLQFTYAPNPKLNGSDSMSVKITQGAKALTTRLYFDISVQKHPPKLSNIVLSINRHKQQIQGKLLIENSGSKLHQFQLVKAQTNTAIHLEETSGRFHIPIDLANPKKPINFQVTIYDGELSTDYSLSVYLTGPVSDPGTQAMFEINTQGSPPMITTSIVLFKEDTQVKRSLNITQLGEYQPHFEITEKKDNLFVTVNPKTGELNLSATPNFYGITGFNVRLTAGSHQIDKSIKVVVLNVNDEPAYQGKKAFHILEDSPLHYSNFKLVDIDNDKIQLSIAKKPENGTLYVGSDRFFYQPKADYFGLDHFSLRMNDKSSEIIESFEVKISNVNDAPKVQGGSVTLGTDNQVPIILPATDADNDTLTYKILNQHSLFYGKIYPKLLELHENLDALIEHDSINLDNEFIYEVHPYSPVDEKIEAIRYQVTDTQGLSATGTFFIILSGDPLYHTQWHLKNTGQTAFAKKGGDPGNDLNIGQLHKQHIRGQGIKILVADTGLNLDHEDLRNNILKNRSIDFVESDLDPSPNDFIRKDHGTAVAGLIAAQMNNRKGGRGVAPEASLIGMNLLKSQTFESWYKSHGMKGYSDDVHIFNQSYGISSVWPIPFNRPENIIQETIYQSVTKTHNQGKGALYIKSSGNGHVAMGSRFHYQGNVYQYLVKPLNDRQLTFQNVNMEPNNASFYNLSIGALAAGKASNQGRLVASYSTSGSALLLASPGGQYGVHSPAMVTTDVSGCHRGYGTSDKSPFHQGLHPLNPECDYTSTMNGTSSAAPNASGVFALLWGARPHLSWRDLKDIMIRSATKVDHRAKGVRLSLSDGDYLAQEPWITNKSGLSFHNDYGFGRINATKAVNISRTHRPLPPLEISPWLMPFKFATTEIPDNSIKGAKITFDPTKLVNHDQQLFKFKPGFVIEAVQLMVNIEHGRDADLSIELTSPQTHNSLPGTRSVLLTGRNALLADQQDPNYLNALDRQADLEHFVMLSHAFYKEPVSGTWTLKVVDTQGGDMKIGLFPDRFGSTQYVSFPNNAENGKLLDFKVRFYGHTRTVEKHSSNNKVNTL